MTGSIRKQATALTMANGATRAVGFAMHLLLARWMGAEALGVMEMAHSVEMLALTPVTAGLPAAMSRLTAQRPACDRPEVLRSGAALVRHLALWLMPALALLSPLIAYLLGDERVLPSIWVSVPGILLLGLGAVYNGYCYGQGNAALPAMNECVEQGVRFLLAVALLLFVSASYTPLPGASGAQEGGFLLYYRGIFIGGTITVALLVWRFFTYYLFLLTGAADALIGTLRRKRRPVLRIPGAPDLGGDEPSEEIA